ncbi:MAG: GNAT family N-acetyltransferase [Halopseudomonas aestusnigri]
MKFQKATVDDLALLCSIANQAKGHWNYSQDFLDKCRVYFKEEFTEDYLERSHTYLIMKSDKVVGMGALLMDEEEGPMLDQFWLLPEHIGKGYGKKAFELFTDKAKQLGWSSLTVISDVYAEGFYLAMGTKRIGELKSEVQDSMLPKMLLEFA